MTEAKDLQPKTGTTTICVMCKDGVVLAADRRASGGGMVLHKRAQKIVPITDMIAVTTSGNVSDVQLITKLAKAEIKLKDVQVYRPTTVREAANLVAGMLYSTFRRPSMILSVASLMMAGKDNEGFHGYELSPDGSVMEIKDFAADGSGMVFALGVLETLYRKNMTLDEGIKLAVKAVNAALQRDTASGNGIDVVTITDKGIQKVLEKELEIRLEA
ncbi:MAG: proteasome subunit beta [Candidatus Woesearchaeota archaeon]